MKYKCDMIQDLMPLCLDNAASESSEKTVIEHLSECKNCSEYYKSLSKELIPIEEHKDENQRLNLSPEERQNALRKIAETTILLSKFNNRDSAVEFLMKETNLSLKECSKAYDFYINKDSLTVK